MCTKSNKSKPQFNIFHCIISYNHKIGCPEIILFLMSPMHEGLKKQTSIFNITLSS